MRKLFNGFVGAVVIVGLICSVTSLSFAKPVKIKAVAFSPVNNEIVSGFKIFAEMINSKFKDDISIQLLGGPEITPPFQLHEAVSKGVIDMCLTSCGYYPSLLWEAQTAMFTNKGYKEIAQTNYYDIMQKLHLKVGLVWLGSATYNLPFYYYTIPEINSPNDFSGRKIRVFPPLIPLTKALGAVPVNLPMGDIYTAMERKIVDGFVMVNTGFVKDFHWNEVTKYVIQHPVYQGTAIILVNLKKWNSLSATLQRSIMEFKQTTVDPAISDYYIKLKDREWRLTLDSGVKPIKFSKSNENAFLRLAYDSAWTRIISKSPKLGPELKRMLVK